MSEASFQIIGEAYLKQEKTIIFRIVVSQDKSTDEWRIELMEISKSKLLL